MKRFLFFIVISLYSNISKRRWKYSCNSSPILPGAQSIKSDDVDTVMTAQGFDKTIVFWVWGAEATYPVADF